VNLRKLIRLLRKWLTRLLVLVLVMSVMGGGSVQFRETTDRVHCYTRPLEFGYLQWTLDALAVKVSQFGLGASNLLGPTAGRSFVLSYYSRLGEAQRAEAELRLAYGDPERGRNAPGVDELVAAVAELRDKVDRTQPIAEGVLQDQISYMLSVLGLHIGGAPFPPVAFRFTRPPHALIVSPRDVIRQDTNISLQSDISLAQRVELEQEVEQGLNVSALVVPTGGIGIYPTMVQETTSVAWVVETIVHEWVHNYLTLRPLGLNYYTSPELRTMNETTASILGEEIGRLVLQRYYPEYVPEEMPERVDPGETQSEPPAFDFRAEMYETRVNVDRLLAQGEIEQAEDYMEQRRILFWENGYRIRRLNQAYFAFYGAYADEPGGAAGEDPVGAAVRALWAISDSPVDFLRTMSWMDDFDDLKRVLAERSAPEQAR
jgi:hypothetical protein